MVRCIISQISLAELTCIAEVAAARYFRLSAKYLPKRQKVAYLKTKASRLKRDMRILQDETEDSLVRDDTMEAAEAMTSSLKRHDSMIFSKNVEGDFSGPFFPGLGGGPAIKTMVIVLRITSFRRPLRSTSRSTSSLHLLVILGSSGAIVRVEQERIMARGL